MTIGLIGYGRFGKFAARHCARRSTVFVYDRHAPVRRPHRGIVPSTLAVAASQPVVILAVPVSEMRDVLREVRPFLGEGALVLDVGAVKVLPVQWMRRMLPRHVRIIGTHPFFGPDAAARSLRGQTAVLCPVRSPRSLVRRVASLLRREGISVLEMSPDRHDRLAAETVFLTQYVGRLVKGIRPVRWTHANPSFRRLMEIVDVARNDSAQLFRDMLRYNRHARRVRTSLIRSIRAVERGLR